MRLDHFYYVIEQRKIENELKTIRERKEKSDVLPTTIFLVKKNSGGNTRITIHVHGYCHATSEIFKFKVIGGSKQNGIENESECTEKM